jgi:hypothetical protein
VAVRTKRARPTPRGFYVEAMSAAEHLALAEAMQVDGLDQEIALLRLRLRSVAKSREDKDLPLMFKGIELLAKVVATRYGLGKTGREEIQEALVSAFTDLKTAMSGGDEGGTDDA